MPYDSKGGTLFDDNAEVAVKICSENKFNKLIVKRLKQMMTLTTNRILVLTLLVVGLIGVSTKSYSQNDLLAEYEQKLTLIEKQFATFKQQIDPNKMSTMDVKMKVGNFENNRNSLKEKIKDLRKSSSPLSETDKGDLDKRFKELSAEFDELKKLAE